MKKTLLIALIFFIGLPTVVSAHAPKKILPVYDSESGSLKIEVVHPVKDVSDHYIVELVITIDGVETKESYTSQSTKEIQNFELEFPGLAKGTIVTISAKCNKLGSKKVDLVID